MKILDQEKMERIKALLKTHPRGLSITNLSSITGLNRNLIAKYLDMLVISGQVEIQQYGPAKVYFPSQRIPVSAMIEITSDLVMVLDQDRKIVHVNKPFTRFLAIPREHLVGKTLGEVGHPFLSSIPLPDPAEPPERDGPGIGEIRYPDATGELFFRMKKAPAVFEDGSVGLTLIIEDITEQKRYQETLRLSEARYRGIVEDQTEFINRYLPDTTLTYVNKALCQYMDCRAEDLLGKRFIDTLPEEERGGVQRSLGSLSPQKPTGVLEHRLIDGRGRIRWTHWTNRAIFDENGTIREYQGMGRDVTDLRETAERISRYILQLEFISRKALEFVHSGPDDDLYPTIARGVKSLCPDAGVCVLSCDGEGGIVRIAAVLDDELRDRIRAILGRDLVGMEISPAGEIMEKLRDGLLHRIPGDIYAYCMPAPTEEELARLRGSLGNMDSCLMGLTHGKDLLGGVLLILREGVLLQNENLLVTYLNQASVAVQRQVFHAGLRESEGKYRSLVEQANDMIVLVQDGVIRFCNRRVAEMWGGDITEILGQPYEHFIDPGELPRVRENYRRRMAGEAVSQPYDTLLLRRDGSRVPADLSAGAVIYGGRPADLIVLRDITEKKKAEEELVKTRALQEAILNASPVGIGLVSDRTLVWENPAMSRILGIEDGTLKGQPLHTVFSDYPEYERASREIDRGIGQRGSGWVETVWKRKDGSRAEVSLRVAPIQPGSPDCIGVATDITDRKQAERALRESEEIFRTMVSINPLPLSLIDATGNYRYVNPAFTRLFGYTPEDIPDGKAWFARAFPDEKQRETAIRLWKSDAEEHAAGEVRPRTFQVRCGDGSFRDILFLPAATPTGLQVVVYQDLTTEHLLGRLRDSEDQYRHLVEDLNIGIYRSSGDPAGRFIWGNTGLISILGYEDLADLQGVPIRDLFIRPEGRKALLGELQEKRFVKNRLLTLKRKDGTPVTVAVTALAEFGEDGKLRFITGLVQELAEEKPRIPPGKG
jgi:PAS domain S-box-containing protein